MRGTGGDRPRARLNAPVTHLSGTAFQRSRPGTKEAPACGSWRASFDCRSPFSFEGGRPLLPRKTLAAALTLRKAGGANSARRSGCHVTKLSHDRGRRRALNRRVALLDAARQAALGGTPSPDTRRPAEEA